MEVMPFAFGHLADGSEFTNRKAEMQRLLSNFRAGINVTLISPRRWGKSSLVRMVANRAVRSDKSIKFCFIDMFSIRSEQEFYQVLTESVIKATSSKFKEWVAAAKRFIPEAIPRVSFDTPVGDFEIGMNWKSVVKSPGQILNLAERICEDKGIRMVICIDEFQNVSTFEDPLGFQKQLRASWQNHKLTAYCIYGSKRHMMMDVFASPSMPFYKFGDLVFLEKISTTDWQKFIVKRFVDTGKKIAPEDAAHIALLVDRHSYYVQQLAQQVWLRTQKVSSSEIVTAAHDSLMRQMGMLFQEKTTNLSNPQVRFLQAILDGVEQLSGKDTLDRYDLGSSSNVQTVKKALISKEVLDFTSGNPEFLDPLYASWLRKYYFGV